MEGLFIIVIVGAVGLAFLLHRLSMEPCPSCGRRGSVRWLHSRRGGGPDRRYAANHRLCGSCDWTDAPPAPDDNAIITRYEEEQEARAAAAQAERQRVEQEAVGRAVVWLLKYIAAADRRHALGEKQLLVDQIRALFPPERHGDVERWAETLKVGSASDCEAMIGRLQVLPLDRRRSIYEALAAMAVVDGKATKSEEARLAKLHQGLGLHDEP